MGALRRRQLIRGLAILVGLNMVVALVALHAHAGDASAREARSRQAAGSSTGDTGQANTTTTTAAAPGNHSGSVTDPASDTFVDGTSKPIRESRADVVRAGAAYAPGGITFTMQLQQPDDPRQDTSWATDTTFVMWSVDTDADGKPDYDIQLSRDGAGLAAVVSRSGDTGPAVCDASGAAYGPDGFSATVDPGCLGNPAAFAYRATMYYDTNPKNDNADVASDLAPNGGLSFPVSRPS